MRCALVVLGASAALSLRAAPTDLPWQRESSFKDAAAATQIQAVLDSQCPQPGGGWLPGPALAVGNGQIKGSLWGPSDRITVSLMKTDVFDRRYADAAPVSLAQIRQGLRGNPYSGWDAYPFPCEKPAGQIIFGFDPLAKASPARVSQSCRDGTLTISTGSGDARAELRVLFSMQRNVVAVAGKVKDIVAPWIRVYRHEDQALGRYRNASGAWAHTGYDYAKDAAWNGPVEPPTSGTYGPFFWVRQRFPAEKTFPQGFECVLMGWAPTLEEHKMEVLHGQKGLGTPPSTGGDERLARLEEGYAAIRQAPGAAATATLVPELDGSIQAYLTVVTSSDAADPLAEAERRLLQASLDGFAKLQDENAAWYGRLYDARESGRIFYGVGGTTVSDDVSEIFRSWGCPAAGGTDPDMRRREAFSSYACLEQDWQPWHGLPRYDEIFPTPSFVRHRGDREDLWWKLVEAWLPAARENAARVYGAPGMMIAHGYLPPVKPDRYVHTDCAQEFCIETAAQLLEAAWDRWDYGGDIPFLRDHAYPALRELANFYAGYARPGVDGLYHLIPSVEAGSGALLPDLAGAQDSIAALCLARWTFLHAADAAERLRLDYDQRLAWRSLATRLPPYPEFFTSSGPVYTSADGVPPGWKTGARPWAIATYPTLLADEITLDSQRSLQEQMLRTVYASPAPGGAEALALLAACPESTASADPARSGTITDDRALRLEVERVPERLLNSRGGRIWLFPCVPTWSNVGFRRFQARGGFLVSAVRDGSGVQYVEIEARIDADCKLMNPWPGRPVAVRNRQTGLSVPLSIDTSQGECLDFSADQGADYEVARLQ